MTLVTKVPGLVGLLLASLGCGDTPPPRSPDAPPEGTASEQLGAPTTPTTPPTSRPRAGACA
jgi:hypothetical protein